MIKRFLLNLILKWYVKHNKTVFKMPVEEEIDAYSFSSADRVEKVLKYEMTNLTLKYFEAHGNKDFQSVLKGQALAYRLLLDRHKKSKYVQDNIKSPQTREKMWNNYKINSWNGDQPK